MTSRPLLLLEVAKYALRADVEYLLKRYGEVWEKSSVVQICRGALRRNSNRSRWLVQFQEPSEATRVAQRLQELQQDKRMETTSDATAKEGLENRPSLRSRRSKALFSMVSLAPLAVLDKELNRSSLSRPGDIGRAIICSNLPRGAGPNDIWRVFTNGFDIAEVRLTETQAEADKGSESEAHSESQDNALGKAELDEDAATKAPKPVRHGSARPVACVVFRHEEDAWRALIERQGTRLRRRPMELTLVQ